MKRRTRIASELMLAPMVIAMRLPLLAQEAARGSSPGRETLRAISEKQAAGLEGFWAAQGQLAQSALSFWPAVLFSGRSPAALGAEAAARAADAAMAPLGRAVSRNHRRLSRRASKR